MSKQTVFTMKLESELRAAFMRAGQGAAMNQVEATFAPRRNSTDDAST